MRSPLDPVSTCTLSIVAQSVVEGTQTVTLVVSMLRTRVGKALTAIGCTFGVLDCGMEGNDGEAGGSPVDGLAGTAAADGCPASPPPPQPLSAAAETRSIATTAVCADSPAARASFA
ncbi:hypothetical protein PBS_25850 [Paraburkholderia sp. 2C]